METDHWNSNRPATRSIAAPGGQVEAIRSGADELDMGFPAELGKIRRRVPRLSDLMRGWWVAQGCDTDLGSFIIIPSLREHSTHPQVQRKTGTQRKKKKKGGKGKASARFGGLHSRSREEMETYFERPGHDRRQNGSVVVGLDLGD